MHVRSTTLDGADAIGFCEHKGFQTVGKTTFQWGEDLHRDLVMVRQVTR